MNMEIKLIRIWEFVSFFTCDFLLVVTFYVNVYDLPTIVKWDKHWEHI